MVVSGITLASLKIALEHGGWEALHVFCSNSWSLRSFSGSLKNCRAAHNWKSPQRPSTNCESNHRAGFWIRSFAAIAGCSYCCKTPGAEQYCRAVKDRERIRHIPSVSLASLKTNMEWEAREPLPIFCSHSWGTGRTRNPSKAMC